MNARSFFDSNILVYTDDGDVPEKRDRAVTLFAECRADRSGVVPARILQEYCCGATHKVGVPAEAARRKVELFARFCTPSL